MNKNNIKQSESAIKNSFVLILGGLICKFLGAFYRIPLSNILKEEGIGVYQLLFPLYTFSLVVVGGGLTFALSRLVSKALALKKEKSISKYFMSALFFVLVVGGIFFLLFSIFAGNIASVQNVKGAKLSYYLIGLSVFISGIIACFRGFFQGHSNMSSTAISQLVEQVVKLGIGLSFSFLLLKYGLYWGVFGAFLGLVASEFFALLYYAVFLIVQIKKKKIVFFKLNNLKFKKEKKELFKLSFPVLLSSLMMPLSFGFQSLVVVKLLLKNGMSEVVAKSSYGILAGMVNSLINLPAIIGLSLAVTLVPSISFLLAKNEKKKADNLIKNVYKTLWIIALPCVAGFTFLSKNILQAVFFSGLSQEFLPLGANLLSLASLQILFVCFVQVATVLLQVISKTWQAVLSCLSFLISNIFLTLYLTTRFGIFGLCVSNVISYAVCCVVCLCFLKNKFDTSFTFKEVFVPLLLTVFMSGIIVLFKMFFENKLPNILFLIIIFLICVLFYFGFLFVFKLIKKQDFILKK